MIETLQNTSLYKSLNLFKQAHHATLFTSTDKELNNNVALLFAKSIICENKTGCNSCFACKQFLSESHPDYILIDQKSIKVEDINNLTNKLNTKPISNDKKVFVLLNAENINEIAQNKLLKSLEEPNPSNIFILSSSKIDKLLPTILSRLNKVFIPSLSSSDKIIISEELKNLNINAQKYVNTSLNLTDIINFETNASYKKIIDAIKYIFENLKSSQDVPRVSSTLPEIDKNLFLGILQKAFLTCINNEQSFDMDLTNLIKQTLPTKAIINCLPLIEDANKKQMANVNFNYILDNLLFNILKEKFLCKQ